MSFLHPSLIGLPLLLLGVPVLIHLINLLRHRRVQWAAMEFLLASQKKNRNWVLLKQLLLLLMRITAVGVVLLMLAQWFLPSSWARIFGEARTHHIVLLDDSYLMTARSGGATAMDRAGQVLERIAARAAEQPAPQTFTLVRFSSAARLAAGAQPDMLEKRTDGDFRARVEQIRRELTPSHLAVSAQAALAALPKLLKERPDETQVVHVVSDLRARAWDDWSALTPALARLNESGVRLNLVDCAPESAPNLAIVDLSPAPRTRAAGVPLTMLLAITNHGSVAVKNVLVAIETAEHPAGAGASLETDTSWKKLPNVQIEEIEPGERIVHRFQVQFETAGQHEVRARLDGDYLAGNDAVALDNTRVCVVPLTADVPVLIVDGDPRDRDAFHVSKALSPGTDRARTGLTPVVQPPAFLRDRPLDQFGAVFLLNVSRLDATSIASLEEYVRNGGGVAFFLGPGTDRSFYNDQLYRDGEGLFPAPLLGPRSLPVASGETGPDVMIEKDSALGELADAAFLAGDVKLTRYLRLRPDWKPASDSTVRIIARVRGGEPLIVEQRFGDGRVVAMLTGADRVWNQWPVNLTYPMLLNELQGYLSSTRNRQTSRLVGSSITQPVDPDRYLQQVTIRTPREPGDPLALFERDAMDASSGVDGEDQSTDAEVVVTIGAAATGETDMAGTYRFELAAREGPPQVVRVALGVDPNEGDLRAVTPSQLDAGLEGVTFDYHQFNELRGEKQAIAGFNTSELLMLVLVALLILEQMLAYSASYHPPRAEQAI